MGNQNEEAEQRVEDGHHRHNDLRHARNPAHPTKDDEAHHDRKADTRPETRRIKRGIDGTRRRKALETDERKTKCHQQQQRIHKTQHGRGLAELLAEAVLDVIGRSTAKVAIMLLLLVELGKRAFEIARRHADKADNPHPEDCARPAQCQCCSNAGNIPPANTPRHGQRKRLEGGRLVGFVLEALAED